MQTEEEKAVELAAAEAAKANTVLSKEAQDALQNKIDAAAAELAKAREVAHNQKIRAEKAERALKETGSDKDKNLDALTQQNELLLAQLAERDEKMADVANQQRAIAVQAACAQCTKLIDSPRAKADFERIISAQVGIVDGKVCVLTAAGTPRVSVTQPGKMMTVAELVSLEIAECDYLQKPLVTGSGTGATGKTDAGSNVQYSKAQLESMNPEELSKAVAKMTPEQLRELT